LAVHKRILPVLNDAVRAWTIGHGTRPAAELVETLTRAGVGTLVDVRRFPGSRRNPQFNQNALVATLEPARIAYRHALELGGRLSGEPGEQRFACIGTAAFRSYLARMGTPAWQEALDAALAEPAPCFLCAETLWWHCHRRFIAELLTARRNEVVHLLGPHELQHHHLLEESDVREGKLYVCGELVA
jgi:uncharacterized protein (DUF488 family)